MELIRWNPRRDMFGMQHRVNHFMNDFFLPSQNSNRENSELALNPRVDIYDKDDHIMLKAELPGVDKEQIEVDVKDRVLTLKGERVLDNEVKEGSYFRRERSFGKFERRFVLPVSVNVDDIKATYKDGLLRVEIPKPVDSKPKQITVH
jgi:HSP20 family protein